MVVRFSCVAAIAWLCLRGAPAAAADDRRLVVIEPSPSGQLSKGVKERLRTAIAEVVTKHGITMMSPSALSDRLLHCEIPGCLPQIAAASGAVLVLHVEAQFAKESFKLNIELWNADDGKLLGKDGRNCPICDEQDLWGSAALLTQGLIERATPVIHPAVPVAPRVPPQPQPATASTVSQGEANPSSKLAVYSGLTLAVAGLATSAVGAYYISVDGKPACECNRVRDTAKYGWPMAVAGGLTLLGGAGLTVWSLWAGDTQIAVGPTGLRIAGRFQ
jgi:hypothetical protein